MSAGTARGGAWCRGGGSRRRTARTGRRILTSSERSPRARVSKAAIEPPMSPPPPYSVGKPSVVCPSSASSLRPFEDLLAGSRRMPISGIDGRESPAGRAARGRAHGSRRRARRGSRRGSPRRRASSSAAVGPSVVSVASAIECAPWPIAPSSASNVFVRAIAASPGITASRPTFRLPAQYEAC